MIRTRSAALAAAAALAACAGADRLRERDDDERRRLGTLVLGDSAVVSALRTPAEPGRIIYDPPTDLSFASLQRARPDLVATLGKPPGPGGIVRRDSTGGDATADTSGGAARPRRPR